jgi:hypothetical protein
VLFILEDDHAERGHHGASDIGLGQLSRMDERTNVLTFRITVREISWLTRCVLGTEEARRRNSWVEGIARIRQDRNLRAEFARVAAPR